MAKVKVPLPPSDPFARATGMVEGRRKCKACGKTYPVVNNDGEKKCPHCGSAKTEPVLAQ